jgi:hypothetical protein
VGQFAARRNQVPIAKLLVVASPNSLPWMVGCSWRLTILTSPSSPWVTTAASIVSPTSVFAPRLVAVGADLDLVHRADVVVSAESEGLSISLPTDLDSLENEIEELGVAFVSIDPLLGVLTGAIDSVRNEGQGFKPPQLPHPTWLERIRAGPEWAPPDQQRGRGDVAAGGTGFASSPVNVRIKISHWPDPTRFCAHRHIHERSK